MEINYYVNATNMYIILGHGTYIYMCHKLIIEVHLSDIMANYKVCKECNGCFYGQLVFCKHCLINVLTGKGENMHGFMVIKISGSSSSTGIQAVKNGMDAWLMWTSRLRFKKMVLSIATDLKLTSVALVSPNSLLRILLWLWPLFKWILGVCSIKNSGRSLLCTTTVVYDTVMIMQLITLHIFYERISVVVISCVSGRYYVPFIADLHTTIWQHQCKQPTFNKTVVTFNHSLLLVVHK